MHGEFLAPCAPYPQESTKEVNIPIFKALYGKIAYRDLEKAMLYKYFLLAKGYGNTGHANTEV